MKILSSKPKIIGIVSIGLVTILALVTVVYNKGNGGNPIIYLVDREADHQYTEKEQKVADDVKAYLSGYLDISKHDMGEIAYECVRNYRTVMASDMTEASDDISDAITVNIMKKMSSYLDPNVYEAFDIEALASGCTEFIWRNVLGDLQSSDNAQLVEMDERYSGLIDSLQFQIDDLAARKTKVNVNVKNNTGLGGANIDIASIEGMSKDELSALAERLGISEDDLEKMVEDELSKERSKLVNEVKSSVKDGKDGKDGAQGARGERGEQGQRGLQGVAGKDGSNGLSTYIFYADDANGTNAGTKVTENSKYMQSVTAANVNAAKSALLASGWTKFKDASISYEYDSHSGKYIAYFN